MFWYAPDPVMFSKNLTTDASGLLSFTIPRADLVLNIQPRTAGEFENSLTQVGLSVTVQFRKFKTAGLGITIPTLLTVSAFEDSPGVVNFDVTGTIPMA